MASQNDECKTEANEGECRSSAITPGSCVESTAINIHLLNQLEFEANRIAGSVDDLTENLSGILRSISALTLDCLETYLHCICKTCDVIDHNIKLMYQLMAKCEELSRVAEPLQNLSQSVRNIKNVLDLFDNPINFW